MVNALLQECTAPDRPRQPQRGSHVELYLLRHGEAEPPGPDGDQARELTDRGRADAERLAAVLKDAGVILSAILTSPLTRARQTAQIVSRVLGVAARADDRLRTGTGLGAVQELLHGRDQVVLVGHEPYLSAIVMQLTGGRVRMQPCAIARVDLDRVEPGTGVLVWLVSPELLKAGLR